MSVRGIRAQFLLRVDGLFDVSLAHVNVLASDGEVSPATLHCLAAEIVTLLAILVRVLAHVTPCHIVPFKHRWQELLLPDWAFAQSLLMSSNAWQDRRDFNLILQLVVAL